MPDDAGEARRTATLTVLFCDLAGSTERQSRLGDDAADDFRSRFFAALRGAIVRTGGQEIKNVGDGLMVAFRHSAVDAVACAIAMNEVVEALEPDDPAQLYVGISAGETAQEDGDLFGTPVVEAARLCARAQPGQILTTDVVRSLVGSRGGYQFLSLGALTMKGLPGPLAVSEVVRALPRVAQPERTASRRRRAPVLALAAAAAVIVAAAAIGIAAAVSGRSNAKSAPPTVPQTEFHYRPVYAKTTCPPEEPHTADIQCGVLTVPEDRSKPDRRKIKLNVRRAAARTSDDTDPVVDLSFEDLATSPVRDHAEELQVAPRGFAGSVPRLQCPEYEPIARTALTRSTDDHRTERQGTAAFKRCHDRWARDVDLNQYNVLAAGDDVVDLVRALHFDHVHLVAAGTEVVSALEVVRRLPGVVRSLTLVGPDPPGLTSATDPTRVLGAALDRYLALCHADAGCRAAYPHLRGDLRRDYEAYRSHPRIANGNAGDGHAHPVLLDGRRVGQAVAGALQNYGNYSLLAAGIAAANRAGTVDQLAADRIVGSHFFNYVPGFSWGASEAFSCSYDRFTINLGSALSSQSLPYLSGVDDHFLDWACPPWDAKKVDDVAFADPVTDVPAFIIEGGLDPGFDPQWNDIFQRSMRNSTLAIFPTLDGSVAGAPPCLGDLRNAFIAAPTKPLEGVADCAAHSPRIQFVAS